MAQGTKINIFQQQKSTSLAKVDLSRKGSIDEPIVDLVHLINQHDQYFTTSSCSGRICVFEEKNTEELKKKGCVWLYTTHDICDHLQVMKALSESKGDAYFKFEPFILHVQCQTLEAAQLMHMIAVATSFRNSGITVGKRGKIMTAVRSTLSLEVPLTHNGKLLVDSEYVKYVVETANAKMKENFQRLRGFHTALESEIKNHSLSQLNISSQRKCSKKTTRDSENQGNQSELKRENRMSKGDMHSRTSEMSETIDLLEDGTSSINLGKSSLYDTEDDCTSHFNPDLFGSLPF